MKKLIIVLSVAATSVIIGCSKDDLTSPQALQNKNTTAATTDVSVTDERLINSSTVLVPAPGQGYVKVFLLARQNFLQTNPKHLLTSTKEMYHNEHSMPVSKLCM